MEKNVYVEITVTISRKRFSLSEERGETEISMTIPQEVAESLDFGNIVKSQLQAAMNDLTTKEKDKE